MIKPAPPRVRFHHLYADLPERFYSPYPPVPVRQPKLIAVNESLAESLLIEPEQFQSQDFIDIFSGNRVAMGSKPLSMVYAGHQFGNWVPRLGDGRAHLLGEIKDQTGQIYDVQLKGSGPTIYSRGGDGRAGLGPVLREFLVSEGMQALGIPTTQVLCAIESGDTIFRETTLPGAVLTRIARSHIRIGTFQYFLSRNDHKGLELLLNFTLQRLYPQHAAEGCPALELLKATCEGQASLIAKWMGVGFIHGVMNTDNMSLSCETIDYGPCAFMDEFHHNKVFSSIDGNGRYAYQNQPAIAHWNLVQLANCLLPMIDTDRKQAIDRATEIVHSFDDRFQHYWQRVLAKKLGFSTFVDGDADLARQWLQLMEDSEADFTLAFRYLSHCVDASQKASQDFLQLFDQNDAIHEWLAKWHRRLSQEAGEPAQRAIAMCSVNPLVIPRNHQIEKTIQGALKGDYTHFTRLRSALHRPFDDAPSQSEFSQAPTKHERVSQTFCGT